MAALRVSTIKRLSTSCSKSHRVFCVFQSSFPCLIPASLCKHDEFIPEVAFKYPIIAIVSLQFSLLTFHDQFSWEKLKSLSLWGVSSSSFMCTNPRDCTQGTRGTPHVRKHPSASARRCADVHAETQLSTLGWANTLLILCNAVPTPAGSMVETGTFWVLVSKMCWELLKPGKKSSSREKQPLARGLAT